MFSKGVENTVGKKEKLLVASSFSFFHRVFKTLVLQTRKKPGLVLERVKSTFWDCKSRLEGAVCTLTNSHTMTPFDAPGKQAFLKKLWEKEKLLVTSNFSFSHSVFYLFG